MGTTIYFYYKCVLIRKRSYTVLGLYAKERNQRQALVILTVTA